MEFPGGQGFTGDDGNTYSVFTDPEDCCFSLDTSNRPCRAPAGEGEATEADFRMPSGPGVYRLPLADRTEPDEHPLLLLGEKVDHAYHGEKLLRLSGRMRAGGRPNLSSLV